MPPDPMPMPTARGPAPGATTPTPRPRRPAGLRRVAVKLPGWGWLEWMVVAQTAIPALLFVPGMSSVRVLTRVGYYGLILLAWGCIALWGRRRPGAASFPARPWLLFCCGYLGLSLFHPETNSLPSGLMQLLLDITVLSPAFWAADALTSPKQISRMLVIGFIGNALSAGVGIGQIYMPERFNPPEHIVLSQDDSWTRSRTLSGVEVIRPSGLTDSPGGACVAGQNAAIIGLCLALMPIASWKRLASLGLAVVGLAVVYFSQVRSALIVCVLCLLCITIILALQRDFKRATLLGVGGAAIVTLGFILAFAVMGDVVGDRFKTLFEDDPSKVYEKNRGRFVQETFDKYLPTYPLGAGLGRWGMMYHYFGDKAAPSGAPGCGLWVEVQLTGWVYDGGAPLLIAYFLAALLAILNSLRIALTCKDRELAFWAAVITASLSSSLALIMSYPVFVSPTGAAFWMFAAALHAADRRIRLAQSPAPRAVAARA